MRSAVSHALLFRGFAPLRGLRRLVGSSGVEPPTSRLSGARSNLLSYEPVFLSSSLKIKKLLSLLGGDDGIRTHDPLLAGQVLSQLSYTPTSYPIRSSRSPKIEQQRFL